MTNWLDDIIQAMKNLGGVAAYDDLYVEIKRLRGGTLAARWQENVRSIIERRSSDSKAFNGKEDIFYSVEGLGRGVWGLRSALEVTEFASDIAEPVLPVRAECNTTRIIRDTKLVRELKSFYNNRCQICHEALALLNNETYSEGHHIRPLGKPHNGPDSSSNILILCPNHHAQCDLQSFMLDLSKLYKHPKHAVSKEFVDYHNQLVSQRKSKQKNKSAN